VPGWGFSLSLSRSFNGVLGNDPVQKSGVLGNAEAMNMEVEEKNNAEHREKP
jgi:hypothetical protein